MARPGTVFPRAEGVAARVKKAAVLWIVRLCSALQIGLISVLALIISGTLKKRHDTASAASLLPVLDSPFNQEACSSNG
jgi:hypothetical protein